MKKIYIGLITLFISTFIFGQEATKSVTLLDEVSAKMASYDNISIEFRYNLENKEEDIHQETKGFVTLEKDKYYLEFLGNIFMFDGEKSYVIIPEDEEVNISKGDFDDEGIITPSKLMSFYKEGYTYTWDMLQNVNGRQVQYIKLTPIDSESEIKHILLGIDAKTKHIYKLIETGLNNTQTTFVITNFQTNHPISEKLFTFDEAKYLKENYTINKPE